MTMNLRQRISHELENFHSGVEYHVMSPERFTMALDAYTDRILTEVREALLSDEAVGKAEDAFAGRNPGVTWGNMFNAFVPDEGRARDAITAAIDAVTGEGGER